jgi:hypothetical protein
VLHLAVDADESALAVRDCRSVEQVSPSDRSAGVPSGPEHDIFGRLAARSVEIASHNAPALVGGRVGLTQGGSSEFLTDERHKRRNGGSLIVSMMTEKI